MLVAVVGWASTDLPGRVQAAFNVPEIVGHAPDFRIDASISSAFLHQKRAVRAYQCERKRAVSVPQGSLLTVKINGEGAKDYKVSLNSPEASQTLEPAGQTGDAYAEYTHALDQSATLVIGGLLETEKSWPLTVPQPRAHDRFYRADRGVNRAVMLFKYKVDDDYGVLSAEAHVDRVAETPEGHASKPAPQIGKPPVFPLSLPRSP